MGLQISLVSSNASGHINTVSSVLNPNNMFISVMSFTADPSATSVNTVQRRTCDTLTILLPSMVLYPVEKQC